MFSCCSSFTIPLFIILLILGYMAWFRSHNIIILGIMLCSNPLKWVRCWVVILLIIEELWWRGTSGRVWAGMVWWIMIRRSVILRRLTIYRRWRWTSIISMRRRRMLHKIWRSTIVLLLLLIIIGVEIVMMIVVELTTLFIAAFATTHVIFRWMGMIINWRWCRRT